MQHWFVSYIYRNPNMRWLSSFWLIFITAVEMGSLLKGSTVEPRYFELAYFELPLISK